MIAGRGLPSTRIDSMMRPAYQAGLARYRPELIGCAGPERVIADPRIAALIGATRIVPSKKLDDAYPRQWGAQAHLANADLDKPTSSLVMDPAPVGNAAGTCSRVAIKAQTLAGQNGLTAKLVEQLHAAVAGEARPAELLSLIRA
jgi:hypothetical protein